MKNRRKQQQAQPDRQLARSAQLRAAISRVTNDVDVINALMRVWNGEKPEDVGADLTGFFLNQPVGEPGHLQVMKPIVFPPSVSDAEKVLLVELRKLVVGF